MLDRRKFLSYVPKTVTLGVLVGAAQAKAVQSDEYQGVGAIENLMRGHGLLLRALIIYDVAAKRIGKGHIADPSLLAKTADVFHNYLQRFHEAMEEKYIFAPMEEKNVCFRSIQELKIQHGTGYELTQRITNMAKAGKQGSELAGYLADFVKMYRYHMAWEDTIVFPAFDTMEQKKDLVELAATIDQEEKQILGHDGFASFISQITDVEKQLDIYGLSGSTPKL
jgi:hemerythrin-like domain-containing protein